MGRKFPRVPWYFSALISGGRREQLIAINGCDDGGWACQALHPSHPLDGGTPTADAEAERSALPLCGAGEMAQWGKKRCLSCYIDLSSNSQHYV